MFLLLYVQRRFLFRCYPYPIVKATAERAKIKKRVYPHLLRHSVATTLLERGMPIDQIQKFLGHSKLETTQVYAESTTEMIKESYRLALSE